MTTHVIKRGLNLPIAGKAAGSPVDLAPPSTVAYTPQEFQGITPKPAVKDGDVVQQGQPLFFDKQNPGMKFLSPAAGRVVEVRRGARRVVTDIIVEVDPNGASVNYPSFDLGTLAKMGADEARQLLLGSGHWGYLRTRPLDRIAAPDATPQAILISATETGPLQPGPEVLLSADDKDAIQAAIYALKAMSGAPVLLAQGAGGHPALAGLQGVDVHSFEGPHPAGDAAVQVNYVAAPRGGGQVWYLKAWEAASLGRFLLTGRFDGKRVYAAVGVGAVTPRFVRTLLGAPLAHIVGDAKPGCRWIRGSVLTGDTIDSARWASFYRLAVHVLPDEVERELLGWITPGLGKFSFHKAFLSGITGGSGEYDLRPGLFGGHRAMVPFGRYEDVVATPDLQPQFLFRSVIAGDLEDSIKLGLLDISPEEAALMTYICPSKIEYDVLLREGLALYVKEA